MISLVIFLHGVYDILCSLCILKLIKIPFLGNYYNLDNIHLSIIKDYNTYLIFLEKYFSDNNAKPLKKGKELIKQIFG